MDDCSCIIYYWCTALYNRTMDVFNSIVLFMVFILEMRGDLMITTKEAIEYLSGRYLVVGSKYNPPEDECKKHNEVVDMAIEAIKKSIPLKTILKKYFEGLEEEYPCCPTCGEILTDRIPADNKDFYFHCINCGQKFDWSEDDG